MFELLENKFCFQSSFAEIVYFLKTELFGLMF